MPRPETDNTPVIPLPDAFVTLTDQLAYRMIGPQASDDQTLAAAVARLSSIYTRERDAIGEAAERRDSTAARLRFFLPRDLPKVSGPLEELAWAGALPPRRRWRVLDFGAGMGAATCGAAAFARHRQAADALEVTAVDRDRDALRILQGLAERAPEGGLVPVDLYSVQADLHELEPQQLEGPFDLVLVGLVLNELSFDLDAQAALLDRLSLKLASGGSLVVLEPALKNVSRALQGVRDRIVASAHHANLFAPCLREGNCPMLQGKRDWCHEEAPFRLPDRLAAVARAAGLRYERLTWSYLTLRRDGYTLRQALVDNEGVPLRIVSAPLVSKGKLEMLGCGTPGLPRLMRLDRHHSEENEALDRAGRGHLVEVRGDPPDTERWRIRPDTLIRPRRG